MRLCRSTVADSANVPPKAVVEVDPSTRILADDIVVDVAVLTELAMLKNDRCNGRCSSNQILFTSSLLLRSSIESSNRGASNVGSSILNEDEEEEIGRRSREYPSSPAR